MIKIPKGKIKYSKELNYLLKTIKKPTSIVISLFVTIETTLEDAYNVICFIRNNLSNLILKIKPSHSNNKERKLK